MTDLIKALRSSNDEWQLEAADRIEQLEALLRHARCPNKDCIDGAYPFGPDGELCECEWCDERSKALDTLK